MFEIESKVTIDEMGEVLNTLQSIDATMNNFLLLGVVSLVFVVAKYLGDFFKELSK